MKELFTTFSTGEIILFIVMLGIAVKEVVSFYDWAKKRLTFAFNKTAREKKKFSELEKRVEVDAKKIDKLFEEQERILNSLEKIDKDINTLIQSDKEDIKSFITDQHHKFCYEQKWIDDYSLDCLERRYARYKEEGGNSFIKDLMNELRALKKTPPK